MQVTDQKGFQSLDVKEKVETCPYCGFKELYNKKDYIYVE
jgi:DNA-directed RNA polymerase subunit RPC12/RpoP